MADPHPEDSAIAVESARSLDMSDGAFKVAIHRLRGADPLRQLVKDQIASSVDGPESLQGELDYLIQALTASDSEPPLQHLQPPDAKRQNQSEQPGFQSSSPRPQAGVPASSAPQKNFNSRLVAPTDGMKRTRDSG